MLSGFIFPRLLGLLHMVFAGLLLLPAVASAQENEMPKYSVVTSEGPIEVRDYPAMIVAEVTVEGARRVAMTQGFTVLAEYIFGANAMSEKIAMTAPVTQQPADTGNWTIHFMMPAKYTMASLPQPKDGKVKLREMAATRFASIRFSGSGDDETLVAAQEAKLKEYIAKNGLKAVGGPVNAFYDPPWIAPEKRRNEIHIEITK